MCHRRGNRGMARAAAHLAAPGFARHAVLGIDASENPVFSRFPKGQLVRPARGREIAFCE